MNGRWFWPLVLLLSALAAGAAALALPGTALCVVVILWFLLVCPGMTVVRCLNLKEAATEWMLAIALSLAIDAIVAAIALYAGVWFPLGILEALIDICIIGVIARFLLPGTGATALPRASRRGVLLFPLLILVALITGMGVWSYNLYTHAAGFVPAASRATPQAASPTITGTPTPTATPTTAVDVIIVIDNVDQIITYDPQGNRYKAAQLFVSMMPVGDEVGIVRITSTQQPIRVLPLQELHASSDRAQVTNSLNENTFGPVDTTPVAYFTPALQMAGDMLLAGPSSHRKLVLIFTDALAFSGDQHACNSSPDAYHNWFCEVQALKQQGTAVALVGFTTPGKTALLQPAQQFFTARGGIILPVIDTDNLPSQLAQAYRSMLGQV
jgi:hypothetical protein